MLAFFQTFSSLPNFHPALVHFPIVLWLVALLFDAVALCWRTQRWLDKAAVSLYILGLIGGLATYWAGSHAADLVGELPNKAELLLQQHSDAAFRTLLFFSVFTLFRVGVAVPRWNEPKTDWVPWRLVLLIGALVGQVFLFQTADLGGALVYREGVAVAKRSLQPSTPPPQPRTASPSHPRHPPPSPASRLQRQSNGTIIWTPAPDDGHALNTFLLLAKGTPPGAIKSLRPTPQQKGLAFDISNRALLTFSKRYVDVRIRTHIALDTFQGTVGLAHHVHSAKRASLFVISTEGWAALYKNTPSRRRRLDRSTLTPPTSPFVLSVSSVGRHLKGYLNKRTIVHGHASPDAPGRVGLFFKGKGRLRILSLTISPIKRKSRKAHHE